MQLRVYKDAKLFAEESTCNPIKDMVVSENFVFSVKDSDLVITEFKTGVVNIDYFLNRAYNIMFQEISGCHPQITP